VIDERSLKSTNAPRSEPIVAFKIHASTTGSRRYSSRDHEIDVDGRGTSVDQDHPPPVARLSATNKARSGECRFKGRSCWQGCGIDDDVAIDRENRDAPCARAVRKYTA
jgi:hypothetical protein